MEHPMDLIRALTPADLTLRVQIPDAFAANVELQADLHLHMPFPPEALSYVLHHYLAALCGEGERERSTSSVLEAGLVHYYHVLDMSAENQEPLPEYDGHAVIAVSRGVVELTVDGLLRRDYETLDPATFRFVLEAIVESLSFHAVPDGRLDADAIVDRGLDRYEAACAA
jgi:hypothetical protein